MTRQELRFNFEAVHRDGSIVDSRGVKTSKRPLSENIVRQVKDALVSGHLAPGQRLSADGLARELNVSHIPVREALHMLEVEGHLINYPNRGYFVPTLSLADVEDVYLWRSTLEDRAHALVVPALSDADIGLLESLCADMEDTVRDADMLRFHRINRDFHFVPFRLLDSPRFMRMLDQLWDSASHYQSVLIRERPSIPHLQTQHIEMVDAYRARDVEAVIRLTREHRGTTLGLMRDVLAQETAVDES